MTVKRLLTFLNKDDIKRCYRHDIETLKKDRNTLKYLVITSPSARSAFLPI